MVTAALSPGARLPIDDQRDGRSRYVRHCRASGQRRETMEDGDNNKRRELDRDRQCPLKFRRGR